MNFHKQFLVRHAGTTPGRGGTTRVKLWFDADDTSAFREFLTRQCDAQGIQGILGTLPTDQENAKALLIVGDTVATSNAAGSWIEGVNNLLATLPRQLLEHFARDISVKEVLAVSGLGSNGTFWSDDREN